MKNGKKFKEENIEKDIIGAHKIMCSEENESSMMITEALNEPHLLELDKQLKDAKLGFNFKDIFYPKHIWGERNDVLRISFDELDSSNVKDYNEINNKVLTDIRNVISATGKLGMIMLRNIEGDYFAIITHSKSVCWVGPAPTHYRYRSSEKGKWIDYTYTEIMDLVGAAYSCVIFKWTGEDINTTYQKRGHRKSSQEGRILNTPEQNLEIAKNNVERYRQMIAKIRSQKNADLEKLDNDVEDILMRFMKLCKAAHKPGAKINQYSVSGISDMIRDKNRWSHGNNYGENGIMYLYDEYLKEPSAIPLVGSPAFCPMRPPDAGRRTSPEIQKSGSASPYPQPPFNICRKSSFL